MRSAPASSIMSIPRSGTTVTPRRSPGCCAGSTSGGPEPTASGPCSPAPHPRPRSSRHSPARRCPATSLAASACPMPGSRQRQARSSSVSPVAAICCHGQATRPYTAVILHPGPNRRAADTDASTGTASAMCSCTSTESFPSCARHEITRRSGRARRAGCQRPPGERRQRKRDQACGVRDPQPRQAAGELGRGAQRAPVRATG